MTDTDIVPTSDTNNSSLATFAQIIAIGLIAMFALGVSASYGWRAGIGFTGDAITTKEDLAFLGFTHVVKLCFEYLLMLGKDVLKNVSDYFLFYLTALSSILVAVTITQTEEQLTKAIDIIKEITISKTSGQLFLILIFPLLMLFIYQSGFDSAVKALKTFNNRGCQANKHGWNWCHKLVENDKVLIEGFLVHQSKNQISIYQKDTNELVSLVIPPTAKLVRQHSPEHKLTKAFIGSL